MLPKLLVVNKDDKFLRYETKKKCHQGNGILHRAFSVYIFNSKGEVLMQKRAKDKLLWHDYWTNSCCSHPYDGEKIVEAGVRRLQEEFGFTCPLKDFGKFVYQANFKDIGAEHEMCSILFGQYDGSVKPDPKEIAEYKWQKPDFILKDFDKNPHKYTPWFKIGLTKILKAKEQAEKENSELKDFLGATTSKVNKAIRELLELYIDKKFYQLIDYSINTGGKRLRPALMIASANILGDGSKSMIYPAAGLEILHNSTLIVDDIIDHSELRRNKPTLWFKFGQSMAECIGLDYLASSFEGANRSKKSKETVELFANTLKIIVEGEMMDILFEQNRREEEPYISKHRYHNIELKDYYDMVSKKTASLFEASCEVGAINANGTKKQIELLKSYGHNLGMAFQITDDILDIFGDSRKFGKEIGKDIKEGKMGNVVILLALSELGTNDKNKALTIIKKRNITKNDISNMIRLINKTSSLLRAIYLALEFTEKAKESLNNLPKNKWNRLLKTIADFSVSRSQ